MTYRISASEFSRLKALFTQAPKVYWKNELTCEWISKAECDIIRSVLDGKLTVHDVIGTVASKLPVGTNLTKAQIRELYGKRGTPAMTVALGRPGIHRVTR